MSNVYFAMGATLLSFFVFIYFSFLGVLANKSNKRVTKWFTDEKNEGRKSFIFLIGDKYDQSHFAEDLKEKLVKANLQIKPSEYMGILIGLFLLLWIANRFILSLMFPIDLFLAHLLVWAGSYIFLKSKQNKRSEEFNRLLPEICRMMSNTVKAGLTLQQGIDMVGREIKAPAGPEFVRISHQLRLGNSFEDVMNQFRKRVASKELQIFVNTMLIQRRVGGNLSEVLMLMAETLEERARVHKEIETVTAESRYIAIILPVLPIIMAIMMNIAIPGFLNPLFTPIGLVILAIFIVMQIISFLIIKKLATIRV